MDNRQLERDPRPGDMLFLNGCLPNPVWEQFEHSLIVSVEDVEDQHLGTHYACFALCTDGQVREFVHSCEVLYFYRFLRSF